MSIATEYREARHAAQQADKLAYIGLGIAGCLLVGFIAVGVMVWERWDEGATGIRTFESPPVRVAARPAPRREMSEREKCLAAMRLQQGMTAPFSRVYSQSREEHEARMELMEGLAEIQCGGIR